MREGGTRESPSAASSGHPAPSCPDWFRGPSTTTQWFLLVPFRSSTTDELKGLWKNIPPAWLQREGKREHIIWLVVQDVIAIGNAVGWEVAMSGGGEKGAVVMGPIKTFCQTMHKKLATWPVNKEQDYLAREQILLSNRNKATYRLIQRLLQLCGRIMFSRILIDLCPASAALWFSGAFVSQTQL